MKSVSSAPLLLLCLLIAFSGKEAAYAAPEVVKIGFITPLTGAQAFYGEDSQKVLQILTPALKSRPGRYRYEIVVEDGQCGLANASATAVQRLINVEGIKFIVATCSGEVMQIAPITERARLIVIGFAASHPDISKLGKYIFRNYVDIGREIASFAKLISSRHQGKVAILTEEASFTLGIKAELVRQLGEKVAVAEDFRAEETDYRALILRAKRSKPDAYYLNPAGPLSYINLFRRLRESGEKQPVYSYYQPEDRAVLTALGSLQDGTTYLGLPSHFRTEEGQVFESAFRALVPEGPRLPLLAATAWDSLHVMMDAIDAVGPDSERVRAYLHEHEFKGAVGRIKFDEHGDIQDLALEVKQIVDGKPSSIS